MTEQEGFGASCSAIGESSATALLGLQVLAVPEALTDHMALSLLVDCGIEEPDVLLDVVQSSDLASYRNTEWRLVDAARADLLVQLRRHEELWTSVHRRVLDHARHVGLCSAELPYYLRSGVGMAYHTAALDVDAGLQQYSELGVDETDDNKGRVWLASRLAGEQSELGIIPVEADEVRFLRAMGFHHDGQIAEAARLLRPLAESRRLSLESAIATHLVGQFDAGVATPQHRGRAIRMVKRSLSLGLELGNDKHVAHVQHTLANLWIRYEPETRLHEAFRMLDSSLNSLSAQGDTFGVAKVLHTYGRALTRTRREDQVQRGQSMLMQSLELGRALGKRHHQAMVLKTLGSSMVAIDAQLGDHLLQESARIDWDSKSAKRSKQDRSSHSRKRAARGRRPRRP